ncbi:hypothetical protein [Streptomyces sp. NPDC002067]
MTTATYINAANFTIVVLLISLNIRSFFKEKKDPKVFLPGLGGMVFGATAVACVGGIIGTATQAVAGTGNGAAGIVPWATGTSDRTIASGHVSGLTIEGGIVAIVVLAFGWLAAREGAKTSRRRVIGGAYCGISLTYTAGVAGLVMEYLVPTCNSVGASIVGLVEGHL